MEEKKNLPAQEDHGLRELEILKAKSDAQFALTPAGQELRKFETNVRMGQMYASATMIPDTYKNNVANCAIAVDTALRMGVPTVMVMQNLYIVHGMPAWSSKFLIATINTCGRYLPLRYECNNLKGDAYGWRCVTYASGDKERKEPLEGPWITWAMVKAEGWNVKKGSKWMTMPEQMFRYRAAAFWQRLYAPEISMGFQTQEEAYDIQDVEFVEIEPQKPKKAKASSIAELARKNALKAEMEAMTAEEMAEEQEMQSEVVMAEEAQSKPSANGEIDF